MIGTSSAQRVNGPISEEFLAARPIEIQLVFILNPGGFKREKRKAETQIQEEHKYHHAGTINNY